MLVKQEFKVDLVDLKNSKDADGVLESIKEMRAREFGYELCLKMFPYKKNEELSFKSSLPDYVLNREHQYTDHYEQRLVIITEEDALKLRKLLTKSNLSHEEIINAVELLT